MASRGNDTDIDQLYQLPLGDFTAARNDLAKAAGKDAGAIKTLEKPSVPAWAVNQLYWHDRRGYDKLIQAAERLRTAHAQSLSGKKVDLATAELQHKAALKTAADLVRRALSRAGDPATPATMKAVIDTLQALPGGGTPGRLTRPLAPLGFAALGALMKGRTTPRRLADVVTFAPPKPKPDEVAAEARRARDAAAKRLKELDGQAVRLRKAAAAARAAFERAEQTRAGLEDKLQTAAAEMVARRTDLDRIEREARAIDQERANLKTS